MKVFAEGEHFQALTKTDCEPYCTMPGIATTGFTSAS